MRIDTLVVEDLRRHRHCAIAPASGVTAITGPNGIGKTTLLEAAHLVLTGLSLTGTPSGTLIRHGAQRGSIAMRGIAGGAGTDVEIEVTARRTITLDGARADGHALRRRFACVSFLPEALDLIKRGPAVRRSMLDRAIVNGWPVYEETLRAYRRTLEQRNALLRRLRSGGGGDDLDVWDATLAPLGARIMETRRRYLERLAPLVGERAEQLGLGERLQITYVPNNDADADALLTELRQTRRRDIERGTTGSGPHLDDLDVELGERPARRGASQGEQRLGVLALLLAEAAVTTENRGEPPILLLDDVLSELDADRRRRLLIAARDHGQVIVTATDPPDSVDVQIDLVHATEAA